MPNILISNVGFGQSAPDALARLKEHANVVQHEKKERISESELCSLIADADILIAGTEKISATVFEAAPQLKLIARVGVGVDNIDLKTAEKRQVSICYTKDAPAIAVPEFALSLILNLIKHVHISDRYMHQGTWHKPMGRMLSSMSIGIVGGGRIGGRLIQLIHAIAGEASLYFYDPVVETLPHAQKVDLNRLFETCDLISLHLPLTDATRHLVNQSLLLRMKKGSYLVNTARGGIVDEAALCEVLQNAHLAGAAVDVFENEPYEGPLQHLENCLLTSHLGSLTQEVRSLMEMQVAEDVIRFIEKKPLLQGFTV